MHLWCCSFGFHCCHSLLIVVFTSLFSANLKSCRIFFLNILLLHSFATPCSFLPRSYPQIPSIHPMHPFSYPQLFFFSFLRSRRVSFHLLTACHSDPSPTFVFGVALYASCTSYAAWFISALIKKTKLHNASSLPAAPHPVLRLHLLSPPPRGFISVSSSLSVFFIGINWVLI